MNLTPKQKHWLLELWKVNQYTSGKMLSVQYDKPPTRIMKALQEKGLCKDIMGTFWEITEEGNEVAKTIY